MHNLRTIITVSSFINSHMTRISPLFLIIQLIFFFYFSFICSNKNTNPFSPLYCYSYGQALTLLLCVVYLLLISILTANEHDRQCECVSFWYSQDAFLCLVALWMLLIQSNRIFIRHCSELLYFYVDRYIQANEMEWTLIERLNQVSNLTAAAAAVASRYVLAAILHFQFNKWFFLLFFHLFRLK